jgi:hypothetical protein
MKSVSALPGDARMNPLSAIKEKWNDLRGKVKQRRDMFYRRVLRLVLLAVVLTRLPFIFPGYGADGDAWRVASVANKFWHTGKYEISRPPGYPLHEILSAPLVGIGGAQLSNVVTLLAALATIGVFFSIVSDRTRHPFLLTITFAFTPLFWINSAVTMDYVWSLLFIFLSLHLVIQRKMLLAGVCLGVAIGFRPTNAVALAAILTLLVTLYRHTGLTRLVLVFLAGCAATAVLSFTPVFLTYGFDEWRDLIGNQMGSAALSPQKHFLLFAYRSIYAVGPLAVLVAIWILYGARHRLRDFLQNPDGLVLSSAVGLGAFLLLFAAFPLDKSYLLPAVPLLLILLDRFSSSFKLALFAFCVLLFGFLNTDVVTHGRAAGSPSFNLHAGMVLEDQGKRVDLLLWRNTLAGYGFEPRTVVMTGTGPAFWFENEEVEAAEFMGVRTGDDLAVRQRADSTVYFVPMLSADELRRARDAGYQIVCDGGNREYIEMHARYSIKKAGIPTFRPDDEGRLVPAR